MPSLTFYDDAVLIDEHRKNKKNQKGYESQEYNKFKENKNKVKPIYLEREIEYNFNREGYRTKDIENLEKDFILVFGCSHTEGIGNFEEDIWCSQLCNQKGLDFLNLGKAGSGPGIQQFNTIQWIKNHYPTPNLVVYQWPQTARKSFVYKKNNSFIFRHYNINNTKEKMDTDWYLKRYCVEPGEMFKNNYHDYTCANLLWKMLGVPVLNWSWTGDFECDFEDLYLIETQDTGRARDLMHHGPDIHTQVAKQLSPLVDKLL
jgi:hypothetical protein